MERTKLTADASEVTLAIEKVKQLSELIEDAKALISELASMEISIKFGL